METLVFFINIIFIIGLCYLWYTAYLDKKTLEKGVNKFIKDEHELKSQVSQLTAYNTKLNIEMDDIVKQHNKITDDYNKIQTELDIAKENDIPITALREFYNQMFNDVLTEDPKCIDVFFNITTKKDYSHLHNSQISNNVFNPYEILKECLQTQIKEEK